MFVIVLFLYIKLSLLCFTFAKYANIFFGGVEEDVEVILENLPSKRQSMLFSATMPIWVKKLARKYLDNPLQIDLV